MGHNARCYGGLLRVEIDAALRVVDFGGLRGEELRFVARAVQASVFFAHVTWQRLRAR
jgi:hypothetical protein